MRIGIVGTGAVATAIAKLLQTAGHEIILGSRSPKGEIVSYREACAAGEVVMAAIPYISAELILPDLANAIGTKVVVDVTNPLQDDWSPILLGQERSAGELLSQLLPNARIVKAFNTVFADVMTEANLKSGAERVTAFIASDDRAAAETVAQLARGMGFEPRLTGPLATARYLEAVAHLNIAIAVGQEGGTKAAVIYRSV